ncbi:MAG: efflux RND transporter periplasmic adaptor subunit [Chitinophagales bacterium]|jgi:HlyD family secretion protein|nr:efflux RND transporter periplasmic adaptor subunit [Chitinophagales bacterium]
MFRKNRLLVFLIAIVAILLIVLVVGKKQGWIGKGKAMEVSAEKISKRTIIERVSASGKIYPQLDVKISPDVSGEVTELYVREGDSVKQGMLLAKIKPDIYKAILDRAIAALNTAKANALQAKASGMQVQAEFDRAEKNYNRNKELYDQKVISQADWEVIEAGYKSAQANNEGAKMSARAAEFSVQSAQASVNEAREDLSKTTIYAPNEGIISQLNIEKGERVLGTTQMEGTDMMHISNLDAIEARVDVSENDVLRVNMGDTAEIELDAYPEKKFKGVVNQIANSARSTLTGQSEQVINFQVKILLLKNSYKELIENEGRRYPFLPGMSASVDIMTNKVMNIMAVPIQSVTTREDTSTVVRAEMVSSDNEIKKNNDSPDEVVFVIDDGEARYKKVTTGIQDDEFIAIRSGLMGQEQIITGPFSAISRMLKNGDPVEVVDKDKLFKKEEDN